MSMQPSCRLHWADWICLWSWETHNGPFPQASPSVAFSRVTGLQRVQLLLKHKAGSGSLCLGKRPSKAFRDPY